MTTPSSSASSANASQPQQHPSPPAASWTGDVWIEDQWTEEDSAAARESLRAASPSPQQRRALRDFRRHASTNWNAFYTKNTTNFFKDRHYLHKAFPEEFGWLYADGEADIGVAAADGASEAAKETAVGKGAADRISVVEIGCGVGNAILPLLGQHADLLERHRAGASARDDEHDDAGPTRRRPPQLHTHCLDFAPTAIQLLREEPRFRAAAAEGRATAHVYDLSSTPPSAIAIGDRTLARSADVALLLFCLSAVGPHPSGALDRAARHVIDMLKPGGVLVLRDYGRGDAAQRKLVAGGEGGAAGGDFCRKGDGTGCCYFALEDLRDLFVGDGKLELLGLEYLRRVYRNRGDGTVRRRVWVQGRFRKPWGRGGAEAGTSGPADESTGAGAAADALRQFLDTSVERWDDHYRANAASSMPVPSLPSNLFQIYPNEFQPWAAWQPTCKKGHRRHQSPLPSSSPGASHVIVVDLGCGLGNETLLQLVDRQQACVEAERARQRREEEVAPSPLAAPPRLHVHFVDASQEALRGLRGDPRYRRAVAGRGAAGEEPDAATAAAVSSHVCDLSSAQSAVAQFEQSADMVLLLFTLSAVGPYGGAGVAAAVHHAARLLKPGGVVLFRDFGRYDDDQLQLNSVAGAQLCDNFYVRGGRAPDDGEEEAALAGTGCYFCDLEEAREVFAGAGLEAVTLERVARVHKKSGKGRRDCGKNGGAVAKTRVWIQGRFRKTALPE